MRLFSSAALLCLLSAAAAHAQRWEISPTANYIRLSKTGLGSLINSEEQDPKDTRLTSQFGGYGLRLTINSKGYYGHEFSYAQTRAKMRSVWRYTDEEDVFHEVPLEDRVKISYASYNLLFYMMPNGEWWRPYITGGVQTFKYGKPNWTQWQGGGWSNVGGNFGAGIKLRAKSLIFRLDVRDHLQGKPYGLQYGELRDADGLVHQLEGSVGIGFTF